MTARPLALLQTKSIFNENSVIELKYKNEFRKGVILSSSRSNGIIIELMISAQNYKQIKLYHSIAMTYYHINKTLKPVKNIKVPQQLFTIGTNIEFKYKNKQWKNGEIININTSKLNETKIKINKTINKDKIITISRGKLIMDYIYHKTIKLTNKIYPFWVSCNEMIKIRDLTDCGSPYIPYKIAYFRDGKSIIVYKTSEEDAITINQTDIKQITLKHIETDEYMIKPPYKNINANIKSIVYDWEIKSDTINNQTNILCNGYIKNNYDEYVTSVIVQLISNYVSDILQDIKNATHKQAFYTSVISIKSFKWFLKIYPNGFHQQNQGFFEIYLCLQSIPSQLKWVRINWSLRLKEKDCKFTRSQFNYWRRADFKDSRFENDNLEHNCQTYGWYSGNNATEQRLSLHSIKDLNQLTFEVKIKYHSVLDINKHFMKFDEHFYTNPILN